MTANTVAISHQWVHKLPRYADSHRETLQDPVAVSARKEPPPAAANSLTA